MTLPYYATVEEIRNASDMRATARSNAAIARVANSVSRQVDSTMHRTFYPMQATRTFDWPFNGQTAYPWQLWLDRDELCDPNITLVSGGTTVPSTNYLVRPDHGPPYDRVEINIGTQSAFVTGQTYQRSISITGLFGYRNDEAAMGTLVSSVNASVTTVSVTDSSYVGQGSVIRIDSERMVVTRRNQLSTGLTLQTPLTASLANDAVAVTDGTQFSIDEVITLDTERMLVVDIVSNTLNVKRQWDGTVLAAHTGSTIYAPRALTVERGALGTTAAAHSSAAAVSRFVPDGMAHAITLAQAGFEIRQQEVSWSATSGAQHSQLGRESTGRALAVLWDQAYSAVGRKGRIRQAAI